jgi:hypothetical protein
MPELSRFYGIIITMFAEIGERHHRPHFHATYQDWRASFSIEDIHILAGELPRKQRRLVEAWAELHQDELMEAWHRLQSGQAIEKIEPLR